jgi:hypothetical protein
MNLVQVMVKHLSRKYVALSSTPSTDKMKNEFNP